MRSPRPATGPYPDRLGRDPDQSIRPGDDSQPCSTSPGAGRLGTGRLGGHPVGCDGPSRGRGTTAA